MPTLEHDRSPAEKRRSTRVIQSIPVTVSSVDAFGQPFVENTKTTVISCHGCVYESKHYVPKNSEVGLDILRADSSTRVIVKGRVVWIGRPRTVGELFRIGIEFKSPSNVWGIASLPNDWSAINGEVRTSLIRTPSLLFDPKPVAEEYEEEEVAVENSLDRSIERVEEIIVEESSGGRIKRSQRTSSTNRKPQTAPRALTRKKVWDVFICHASEDKESFVRPLAKALRDEGLEVWYDEFTLLVGDSLRRSIDKGLASSRFGAVVVSPSFFAKEWPQKELDGLVAKEISDRRVILPVWHKVSANEVRRYSATLADRVAANSAEGVQTVVKKLVLAIKQRN